MKDNIRQKWESGLSGFLEPGERVEAAARGMQAKFWQLALLYGYIMLLVMKRFRTYVVTDRNVYVFQSASGKYKASAVLEKQQLGQARVELNGSYLTFDGKHETYVGIAGPGKRWAREVAEAASKSPAGAQTGSAAPGPAA
jgi:hypothetical protein